MIHSDTQYQKKPALYCAFIALQDVTFEMGGTLFFPKTQNTPKSAARRQFDAGGDMQTNMLAKSKPLYTMLKGGRLRLI